MKRTFALGAIELSWLNGGRFELDGGAMFGVVPKLLWSKKYTPDEENFIPLAARPILIKTSNSLVVLESGLGNKLTEKQKKVFRVREEWGVPGDLKALNINREDIDFVILTHYDFDHAGGVIMTNEHGQPELTFPKARHIIQKSEWEDALNPGARSIKSYWPVNFELLMKSKNLELIDGEAEIIEGIRAIPTGGHSRGHQAVHIASDNQTAVYLGDLLPTRAHFNPLWITAYDDFPLDSIKQKERFEDRQIREGGWFIFYHDALMLACKFNEDGSIREEWNIL